jgi:PKD repeat protein
MAGGGTLDVVSSLLELATPCNTGCAGLYVTTDNSDSGETNLAKLDQDTFVAGTTSGGAPAGWATIVAGNGSSESSTAELDSSVGVGFPVAGVGAGGAVECYENSGTGAVSVGYSNFNFTGMTGSSGSVSSGCPAPTLTSNQNQGGSSPVLPVFVDAAAGDYRPAYNSPLVDAGDPSLTGGTDLDGNPRVVNGKGTSAAAVTDIGAYEYQRGAPTVTATGPSTSALNQPLTFTGTASDPNDGESISSYSWQFDDGATATGASVTHAYAGAGTHTATLTVTEPNGLSASTTVTTTVTVVPTTPPLSVSSPPVLSGLSFIQGRTTGKGKKKHTTPSEIRLHLSEAAAVTITLERAVAGRKHGKTCVAATHARRHLPKCTRELSAGKVKATLNAGADLAVFKKKLPAGSYQAMIGALAGDGQSSAPATLKFRVK